jgi:hypothetical protein
MKALRGIETAKRRHRNDSHQPTLTTSGPDPRPSRIRPRPTSLLSVTATPSGTRAGPADLYDSGSSMLARQGGTQTARSGRYLVSGHSTCGCHQTGGDRCEATGDLRLRCSLGW